MNEIHVNCLVKPVVLQVLQCISSNRISINDTYFIPLYRNLVTVLVFKVHHPNIAFNSLTRDKVELNAL